MRRSRPLLALLAALLLSSAEGQTADHADGPGAQIFGRWVTEGGESHVEIAPCEDLVCGTIVWLKMPLRDDGKPIVDSYNDDPALRDRTVLGLRIMDGFRLTEDGGLDDGTIYNPEDGNKYAPTFTPQDDGTLELEACVLFFCQSQSWVRIE